LRSASGISAGSFKGLPNALHKGLLQFFLREALRGAAAIASSRISALGGFGALGLIFLHAFGPRFPGVFAAGRAVSVLCVAGNDAHSGGQHDEGKFAQFHNLTVFLWF